MINGRECTQTPITTTAKSSSSLAPLPNKPAKIVHPCAQTRRHRAPFPGRHAKKMRSRLSLSFPKAEQPSEPPHPPRPRPPRLSTAFRRSRRRLRVPVTRDAARELGSHRSPSRPPLMSASSGIRRALPTRAHKPPTHLPSHCISARKAHSRARCARSGRVPGARSAEGHRKRGRQGPSEEVGEAGRVGRRRGGRAVRRQRDYPCDLSGLGRVLSTPVEIMTQFSGGGGSGGHVVLDIGRRARVRCGDPPAINRRRSWISSACILARACVRCTPSHGCGIHM